MRAALLAAVLLLAVPASVPALEGSYVEPANQPTPEPLFTSGLVSAFLFEPDGNILYADLGGSVKRFDMVARKNATVLRTGAVIGPEWGLTGLARDDTGAIYTMYTTGPPGIDPSQDDVLGEMRVSRWVGNNETILLTTEATRSHNGGRLLFHNGTLFVTVGEHTRGSEPMAKRLRAQDPGALAGKVLRMLPDGSPAPGNPAETDPRFHPLVYSYGHRNPFGIAWDERRNILVLSDPAQDRNEEINHVPKGGNLGWPLCVGPCNPTNASLIDPIVLYPTTITPVGMAVLGDDYYVGAFNQEHIRRVYETENGWTDEIIAKVEAGMLDVNVSPDGKWILASNWNGIWRIPVPGTTPPPDPASPKTKPTGGERVPAAGAALLFLAAVAILAVKRRD